MPGLQATKLLPDFRGNVTSSSSEPKNSEYGKIIGVFKEHAALPNKDTYFHCTGVFNCSSYSDGHMGEQSTEDINEGAQLDFEKMYQYIGPHEKVICKQLMLLGKQALLL